MSSTTPHHREVALGLRRALLARAEALGQVSRDPELHLVVDGVEVRADSVADRVYRFALPAGARDAQIASRSTEPRESEPHSLDPRRLGVPVERILLAGTGLRIVVEPGCASLDEGFHADEGSHRWTDGSGRLPESLLACFPNGFTIMLRLGSTALHYPVSAAARQPEKAPHRSEFDRRARGGGDPGAISPYSGPR